MAIKRLILDIETTPNVGYFWSAGWKKTIPHQSISRERAVICVAYKWEGDKTVHSIAWDAGDDKALLGKLIPVINSADEVIGHNSDNFDLKWLRTRAAFHGLRMSAIIKGVDTLKMAKAYFLFNSNSLAYISKFLGVGSKIDTGGFGLWQDVIAGSEIALAKMVKYCKGDVSITEKVYNILRDFAPVKTHTAVVSGGEKYHCPQCASTFTQRRGFRTSSVGDKRQIMHCTSCGRNFTIAKAVITKMLKDERLAA